MTILHLVIYTICISTILKYIVGNSYNNNHLTSILDWFWMKSAGSQTVLAPSFPQNGTLTENVTR